MNNRNPARTATEVAEWCNELGLPAEQVEWVVAAGGPVRHAARVEAVMAAATTEFHDDPIQAAMAAWVEAHVGYSGGGLAAPGAGSARAPWASDFGRRQARCGAMWTSAITEAAQRLREVVPGYVGDPQPRMNPPHWALESDTPGGGEHMLPAAEIGFEHISVVEACWAKAMAAAMARGDEHEVGRLMGSLEPTARSSRRTSRTHFPAVDETPQS
jgi:hypothetical protein